MNALKRSLTILLAITITAIAGGQSNSNHPNTMNSGIFQVVKPDFQVSPNTGMTRQHYKDAALYLLEGAFSYINELDDPMRFPKQPGVSYPRDGKPNVTEDLEGLCRTLFIAAPLLIENPDLVVNNIKVADYYRHQMLNFINPESPMFIQHMTRPGRPTQTLVEFGALAISLSMAPEVLWDPIDQEQKDALAALMLSYGTGPTVSSNWRFFNIFVMSFFKDRGYEIDEALMVEYIQKSLDLYRGYGWYNDSPAYDYYSMWGFQMYGMLWAQIYGNRLYPEYAEQFIRNFSDLTDNYPYLFNEKGEMIMYGRSIAYRMSAAIPFPLMGFLNNSDINYGWMRSITSSTLLQFFEHPEFLKDNVPTLGFYGAFEPAVQIYSCRGSVYWMGKIFAALLIPDDNPFWTAVENNGAWDNELKKNQVYNKFQPGSNTLITNYPNIGASEIRAWCHEKVKDDWQKFRSTENYNRLSYNSEFHWQADGTNGEVAMNYIFKNATDNWEALRLYTFKKFENGIYYRDVVLETNENVKMNLADIPLVNGILRVDRNISTDPVEMRLGHYALPEMDGAIIVTTRKVKGKEVTIIDNGIYQLAMVPLTTWNKVDVVTAEGLHPISNVSKVIILKDKYVPAQSGSTIYATLMLWKKSGEKWKNSELMPVKNLNISPNRNEVEIVLTNKNRFNVVFED